MKTILVADDSDVSRELICECIEDPGYSIIQASNGREALDLMRQQRPDIVLLDIQMPELDGYGVLKQMRADPLLAMLPAIAITAFAMESDRATADAAGFDAYMSKPINVNALRQEISRLLGLL